MARDPVWTDPTANPYLFDAAAVRFDGISGRLDGPTVFADPTRPGSFDSDSMSIAPPAGVPSTTAPAAFAASPAAASAGPSSPAPSAAMAPARPTSSDANLPAQPAQPAQPSTASAAATPTSAAAVSASEPEPVWSRTGTYAAGQLATVGKVDTADISDPAGRRRRPLPAGRRSEPAVRYQPVAVYRSQPGTLAAPTLEQTRAQLAADRMAELSDSRSASGRSGQSGQSGRASAARPGKEARPAASVVRADRDAQRGARKDRRVSRRSARSGRRAGKSAQSELAEQILGAAVIVAFFVYLIVRILAK